MTQLDSLKKKTKTKFPFPVRVLSGASPGIFVMLPILWLTEYPAKEWPFVSGVLVLCLIGSGTLAFGVAILAIKGLHRYARAVANKLGVVLDQPENETPSSNLAGVICAFVVFLLVTVSSWGLALYVLALVMALVGMAPIGAQFSQVALTILVSGAMGFTVVVGGFASLFYAADHHPRYVGRFSRGLRNWTNLSGEMGKRWQVPGTPTLTGKLN